MRRRISTFVLTALLAAAPALARDNKTKCSECERNAKNKIKRSKAAIASFKKQHPCPSTGKTTGACKGYVIDHVKPLKGGGEDAPENMQWQTVADAKAKDKIE